MKDSEGTTTDLSAHVMALQDRPALRSLLLLNRAKAIPSLGEHRCNQSRAGREGREGLLSPTDEELRYREGECLRSYSATTTD